MIAARLYSPLNPGVIFDAPFSTASDYKVWVQVRAVSHTAYQEPKHYVCPKNFSDIALADPFSKITLSQASTDNEYNLRDDSLRAVHHFTNQSKLRGYPTGCRQERPPPQ